MLLAGDDRRRAARDGDDGERAVGGDHDVRGVDLGVGAVAPAGHVGDPVDGPQAAVLERSEVAHGQVPGALEQPRVGLGVRVAVVVGQEPAAEHGVGRREDHVADVGARTERRHLALRPADHVGGRRVLHPAQDLGVAGAGHEVAVDVLVRLVEPVVREDRVPAVGIQQHDRARRLEVVDQLAIAVTRRVEVDQQHVGRPVGHERVAGALEGAGEPHRLPVVVLEGDLQRERKAHRTRDRRSRVELEIACPRGSTVWAWSIGRTSTPAAGITTAGRTTRSCSSSCATGREPARGWSSSASAPATTCGSRSRRACGSRASS